MEARHVIAIDAYACLRVCACIHVNMCVCTRSRGLFIRPMSRIVFRLDVCVTIHNYAGTGATFISAFRVAKCVGTAARLTAIKELRASAHTYKYTYVYT